MNACYLNGKRAELGITIYGPGSCFSILSKDPLEEEVARPKTVWKIIVGDRVLLRQVVCASRYSVTLAEADPSSEPQVQLEIKPLAH